MCSLPQAFRLLEQILDRRRPLFPAFGGAKRWEDNGAGVSLSQSARVPPVRPWRPQQCVTPRDLSPAAESPSLPMIR